MVSFLQVRQEARHLLNKFPDTSRQQQQALLPSSPHNNQLSLQQAAAEDCQTLLPSSSSSSSHQKSAAHKFSISKRISVPENFVYFPAAAKQLALQQQLLQHRLLQKRQSLQKQRYSHAAASGETLAATAGSGARPGRSAPYGLKPYLPTDCLQLMPHHHHHHQGGSADICFQPIAEDESQPPPPPLMEFSRQPLAHSVSYHHQQQQAANAQHGMASADLTTTAGYFPHHGYQDNYTASASPYDPSCSGSNSSSTCEPILQQLHQHQPSPPNDEDSLHSQLDHRRRHDASLDGLPREMENICKLTDSPRGSPAR